MFLGKLPTKHDNEGYILIWSWSDEKRLFSVMIMNTSITGKGIELELEGEGGRKGEIVPLDQIKTFACK